MTPRYVIRWCKQCGNPIRLQPTDWPHRVCPDCYVFDGDARMPVNPPAATEASEADEEEMDAVTRRLMDDALPRRLRAGRESCPKCWRPGYFKRGSLCCEIHGAFAGL